METGIRASGRDIILFTGAGVSAVTQAEEEGGRGDLGRKGICCHGERFLKQLLIRPCCCAPCPFFSSLSLCYRQPFRREICVLRGQLWTFLLQSFYAVRHTQGWDALPSKHRARILAGNHRCSSLQDFFLPSLRQPLLLLMFKARHKKTPPPLRSCSFCNSNSFDSHQQSDQFSQSAAFIPHFIFKPMVC